MSRVYGILRALLRSRHLVAALAAVAMLGGCGGGDTEGVPHLRGAPRPAEPLSSAIDRFKAATEKPTCAGLASITHSQYRQSPLGSPLRRKECSTVKQKFERLSGLQVTAQQDLQTGALVDTKLKGATLTALFVLDVDRKWKFAVLLPAAPQVGTQPKVPRSFDENADTVVRSTRARTCSTLDSLVAVSSPYYAGKRSTVCRRFLGSSRDRDVISRALKDDPAARPARLGLTRDFGFYGLRVRSGRYDTLIMVTQPGDAPRSILEGKASPGLYELLAGRAPRA